MAIKTITVCDMCDAEGASALHLAEPESGKGGTIDACPECLAAYTSLTAPFMAKLGHLIAANERSAPKVKKGTKGKRKQREYDKEGYRAWAEAQGLWTGNRPPNSLIDQYEAQAA